MEGEMMKRLILAFLLVSFFAVPVHAFENGSFEFGTATGDFDTIDAGSNFIAPWIIDSGDIDVIRDLWTAADGNQSIDLNGGEAATIRQTIPTNAGCTYRITFSMSGNSPAGSGTSRTLDLYMNGLNVASFSTTLSVYDTSPGNWEEKTFEFPHSSPGHTMTIIEFMSTTSGPSGPAIDNVRLEELSCPPPASIPTMNEWGMIVFMALAGLIAVYYMRKQTTV